MLKHATLALLVALALPFTANRAEAQISLLPYVGYNLAGGFDLEADDPDDRSGAFLVGFGAEFGLPVSGLALKVRPSVEYYFLSSAEAEESGVSLEVSQSRLQVNGDVIAQFSTAGAITPYAGAGLVWASYGAETEICFDGDCESEDGSESGIGFNVLGGVQLGSMGFGSPFIQARYTILSIEDVDFNGLSLMGGVVIPLGAQ